MLASTPASLQEQWLVTPERWGASPPSFSCSRIPSDKTDTVFSQQHSAQNQEGTEDSSPSPLFAGCTPLNISFSGTQFTHSENRDNNRLKESRKLFVIQSLYKNE